MACDRFYIVGPILGQREAYVDIWCSWRIGDACNDLSIHLFDMYSVSNVSNMLEWLRVRVGTGIESLQWHLPLQTPDRCNWAGFTTKHQPFQPHNVGSNSVFEFVSYRDMLNTQNVQFWPLMHKPLSDVPYDK